MDEELKGLAALALRNEFYGEFSALCNKYLKAGEGLSDTFDYQLQDLCSLFGRDDKAKFEPLDILTLRGTQDYDCDTLADALESYDPEVYVNDKMYFELRDGEYYWVGD